MIIISVGSNLPGAWGDNPYEMCQKAFYYLGKKLNDTSMVVSPMYQTTPIPPSSQPLYINGVILFDSQIPCEDLLSILNDLEDKAGRIRQKINESRPLDLDIIAYHDKIIKDSSRLIVPHPRAHLRAFVLYPLRDVLPNWIHPESKKSLDELISELPPDQGIEPYI